MTLSFQPNFDLRTKNSLSVPSICRWYAVISNRDQLPEAVKFSQEQGLPLVVLGSGTNVLLAERIEAIVIQISILGMHKVDPDLDAIIGSGNHAKTVEVAAGENWHQFVRWSLDQQLYGLENLALIPGTCGAAPIQNIGAYGVEFDQFVESVEVFDLQQQSFRQLSKQACEFGYRDSIFKRGLVDKAVVVSFKLTLSNRPEVNLSYPVLVDYLASHGLEPSPENIFDAVCAIRSSKLPDPKKVPNVGSFFKNPLIDHHQRDQLLASYPDMPTFGQSNNMTKLPAAWLIDQAGWKGYLENGVGVHDKQALVLVNPGARPISEILDVAGRIQNDISAKFGIDLKFEPRQIS